MTEYTPQCFSLRVPNENKTQLQFVTVIKLKLANLDASLERTYPLPRVTPTRLIEILTILDYPSLSIQFLQWTGITYYIFP